MSKVMKMKVYFPRLKDLRDDADKTQAEIAELLGISQQYYGVYERGERELPMTNSTCP